MNPIEYNDPDDPSGETISRIYHEDMDIWTPDEILAQYTW